MPFCHYFEDSLLQVLLQLLLSFLFRGGRGARARQVASWSHDQSVALFSAATQLQQPFLPRFQRFHSVRCGRHFLRQSWNCRNNCAKWEWFQQEPEGSWESGSMAIVCSCEVLGLEGGEKAGIWDWSCSNLWWSTDTQSVGFQADALADALIDGGFFVIEARVEVYMLEQLHFLPDFW